ncbi:hypothetical protein ES703_87100 [subsurface metagenome]
MGAIDEHWCSDCKRTLDKTKDEYLDLENIRIKEFPGKKGIICKDCLQKPEYDALRKLLGAGNPGFTPFIECALHTVCSTFKRIKSRPVRCGHIAVIGDTVYCKRRHPGSVKLPIERAERVRLEQTLLIRTIKRMTKGMPPEMATAFTTVLNQGLSGIWIAPSAVIAEKLDEIKSLEGE